MSGQINQSGMTFQAFEVFVTLLPPPPPHPNHTHLPLPGPPLLGNIYRPLLAES